MEKAQIGESKMNESWAVGIIIGMCVLVLAMGALKQRAEWLLNFLLRAVFGALAIFVCNFWLASRGISQGVGINLWTLLTSGTLGIPGVVLLYGIHFCTFL